jgi:hypothetical protein
MAAASHVTAGGGCCGRSVIDALALVTRFGRNEWALLSMREALDTSTAVGRFTLTILAAVAELERNMIGERTHDALMQLKAEGRRYCGIPPWGKKLGPDGGWVRTAPSPVRSRGDCRCRRSPTWVRRACRSPT